MGDDSGFRFTIGTALKDVGYYMAMAEELDATRRTAEAIRQTCAKACADGHARAAVLELIGFLNERS